MLLLLLKGPESGCEELRLRIGCARRRRSRRGVGGWPCLLLLVVSVSRRRLLRAVFDRWNLPLDGCWMSSLTSLILQVSGCVEL